MIFIGYYRVSSQKQGQRGLSLEAQKVAVRRYVTGQLGAELVADFVEVESGTRNSRPGLAQAMAECRRRKGILIIAKLDRLARNVAFVSSLLESNVDFIACDQPHASRMMLQILSVFAEHEARVISERTKAALTAAKARGTQLGKHGKVLALQHKQDAKRFAEIAAGSIEEARRDGATTFTAVADHLNRAGVPTREGSKWHPITVSRVLNRLEWSLPDSPWKAAA